MSQPEAKYVETTVKGTCFFCGKPSEVVIGANLLDQQGWKAYQRGAAVQWAFHHWPASKREVLLSGIHPECFESMKIEGDED